MRELVLEEVPEEVLVPVFLIGSPWDAKKWLGEKQNLYQTFRSLNWTSRGPGTTPEAGGRVERGSDKA